MANTKGKVNKTTPPGNFPFLTTIEEKYRVFFRTIEPQVASWNSIFQPPIHPKNSTSEQNNSWLSFNLKIE